jgi:hypothetical protein
MNDTLVVIIGFAILAWVLSVPRIRERNEFDRWWREYTDKERRDKLQLAWRLGFRRSFDETEDEFIMRFNQHHGLTSPRKAHEDESA